MNEPSRAMVLELDPRDLGADLATSPSRKLFALNTVFLVFAVVCVALRFVSKRFMKAGYRYAADDMLCLAACVAYVAQVVIVYIMILRAHAGNSDLTPQDISLYMKMGTAVQFPYGFAMGFVRLSIMLLERRVFGVQRMFRHVCDAIMAVVVAWIIYVVVIALTICHPIARNWDPRITSGHCGDVNATYQSISGSGIIIDLAIFITPIPIIWRLNMTVMRKLWITLLFAIGLFDIVTGAMRLVATTIGVNVDPVLGVTWGILEPSIAIFVACAPTWRPLFIYLATETILSKFSLQSLLQSLRQTWRSKATSDSGAVAGACVGDEQFELQYSKNSSPDSTSSVKKNSPTPENKAGTFAASDMRTDASLLSSEHPEAAPS